MKKLIQQGDVVHPTVRAAYFTYHTDGVRINLRTRVEVTGGSAGGGMGFSGVFVAENNAKNCQYTDLSSRF